jgi:hypothetical protein
VGPLRRRLWTRAAFAWGFAGAWGCSAPDAAEPLHHSSGLFEQSRDVGDVGAAGGVSHEGGSSYRVSGAGYDVWWDRDAFHFASRAHAGDVRIEAELEWLSQSTEVYRKALLMLRESFEPDAAYADVAVHGGGLAALQYRPYAGAPTLQLVSRVNDPRHARLERRGNLISAFFSREGDERVAVGPVPVDLPETVQAGIGACSHDRGEVTSVAFEGLRLEAL